MLFDEDRELKEAAILAAENLNTSVKNLSKDTEKLSEHGRRTRFLIKVLGLSIIIDFVLSFVLILVALEAIEARDNARVAKTAEHVSCVETNKVRAAQVELWQAVLSDAQVSQLNSAEQLRTLTEDTFKQRECVSP